MSENWVENPKLLEKNSLNVLLGIIMVFINVSYAVLIFLVIYPSDILSGIPLATDGIIDETFIIYIPLNILNFIFFFTVSKMSLRDLGLSWKKLWQGVLIFLGIWVVVELIMLGIVIGVGIQPIISTQWLQHNVIPLTIGGLVREFFGNSLFEEVLYRGILVPQLYLLFKRKNFLKKEILRWFLAIIISQIVFALMHIPSRLLNYNMTLGDLMLNLLMIFGIGVIFALVYLSTRNLVASIGVHALNNLSIAIVQHLPLTSYLFLFISLVLSLTFFLIRFFMQRKESKAKSGSNKENTELSSLNLMNS